MPLFASKRDAPASESFLPPTPSRSPTHPLGTSHASGWTSAPDLKRRRGAGVGARGGAALGTVLAAAEHVLLRPSLYVLAGVAPSFSASPFSPSPLSPSSSGTPVPVLDGEEGLTVQEDGERSVTPHLPPIKHVSAFFGAGAAAELARTLRTVEDADEDEDADDEADTDTGENAASAEDEDDRKDWPQSQSRFHEDFPPARTLRASSSFLDMTAPSLSLSRTPAQAPAPTLADALHALHMAEITLPNLPSSPISTTPTTPTSPKTPLHTFKPPFSKAHSSPNCKPPKSPTKPTRKPVPALPPPPAVPPRSPKRVSDVEGGGGESVLARRVAELEREIAAMRREREVGGLPPYRA